jgi:hypothetical protein
VRVEDKGGNDSSRRLQLHGAHTIMVMVDGPCMWRWMEADERRRPVGPDGS